MTLQGRHLRLILWRRCSLWAVLLTATLAMGSGDIKSRPTTVPGSDHLVLSKDFPYEFWQASGRPYTLGPPPRRSSEPTNYGYFYGQTRDEADSDPNTWQILPIQIPDDLVGDLDFWTQRTTTEVPTYPTPPTPQYGRHPGGTEPPHLFRPERLYTTFKNNSNNETQTSGIWRRNQEGSTLMDQDASSQSQSASFPGRPNQTKRPDLFSSWTQSLRERLEPYIDTTRLPKLPSLPKFPKLPSISSITRLPKLPVWPLSILQDTQMPQVERVTDSNITDPVEHVIHKFYPILANAYPTDQSNKKRRKNKRPNYLYPPNHHSYPSNHFSPNPGNQNNLNSDFSLSSPHTPNYDQNYVNNHSPPTQHLPGGGQHPHASSPHQGTHSHDNIGYEHDHRINHEDSFFEKFSPLPNSNHRVKHLKRPHGSQSQPSRNSQDSQNRRQGIQEHPADEQYSQQQRPVESQHHPTGNHRRPIKDQSRPEDDLYHHVNSQRRPNINHNWSSEGSNNQAHNMNTLFKNTNHQSNQRNPSRNPYRNRPNRPLHPDPNRIYRRGPQHSFGSRPHFQLHQVHDYHPSPSEDWTDHLTHPLYSESYSDVGIIERLTSLDPLSSSFVIPGGLVVVALALAVYYFTYVWYPTPVVTAKVVKFLSDSAPENLLTADQQKAIREVRQTVLVCK